MINDYGMLIHKWNICNTIPHPKCEGSSLKIEEKDC